MRMKNRSLLLLFLFVSALAANAQEYITPLDGNNTLREKFDKHVQARAAMRTTAAALPLALPFLDDFSKGGPWPDSTKWIDDNVFINATFPKAPPTIGVATFDGLRNDGLPYSWTVGPASSKLADSLTSQPIDLSGLTAGDSVYFSFFYQAQGRGNAPEAQDSLMLEFKEPSDTVWTHVWAVPGYSLTDSTFNFVLIRLDTRFLYSSFQFKFKNRATLSGNVDHWHIDYVYLDKNRFNPTRSFSDVAFVYPSTTLLKGYHAMPWKHFAPSDMDSIFWNPIRNNSTVALNEFYSFTIYDENGTPYTPPSAQGAGNILPYDASGYTTCPGLDCANLRLVHTSSYIYTVADCTYYDLQHVIVPSATDINRSNDTLRTRVPFYNYFAYDDGSAELAYGISSAFAQVAYKFTLRVPDTLRAVAIYWNPVLTDVSQKQLRIAVWGDNGGVPGAIKYQSDAVHPEYQTGYNGFTYYEINDTTLSLGSGVFYVGFVQIDPETLNVGLDMNSNAQSKIFYNTTGNWNNTIYKGALMMRPFLGSAFTVGVPETENKAITAYSLYPNPAQSRINVRGNNGRDEKLKLSVYDASGRMIIPAQQDDSSSIDVSALAPGLYFIKIENAEGTGSTQRFIIAR
jgi:hypothetical protein